MKNNDFEACQVVISLDGTSIPCNYLSHDRFDNNCGLCAGLHLVFIRFAPERSYSKGYEVRKAINCFLDYVVGYEALNPKELHLSDFEDFTAEHLIGFQQYSFKNNLFQGIATRLKGAIYKDWQQFGELPAVNLPVLKEPSSKSYPPLSDQGYESLTEAFKENVDRLYSVVESRNSIDTVKAYSLEELTEAALTGPINTYYKWLPDPRRVLKTLLELKWPFEVQHSEVIQRRKKAKAITNPKNSDGSLLELLLIRYNSEYITICKARKFEGVKLNLDDVLSLYFPIDCDQVCIGLSIMLQTGWNKEMLLAIDYNQLEHALSGTLSTDTACISSEKERSQSTGLPFFKPKSIHALSDRSDKYSAINLIQLAKDLSAPLGTILQNNPEKDERTDCSLFLCFKPWSNWLRKGKNTNKLAGSFFSLSDKETWENGVKSFLKNNIVIDDGVRLLTAKHITPRLRPTWFRLQKKIKPLSILAAQQGHESKDTTDIHYDSSSASMKMRRDRLRIELDEILGLLRKRKFKGLIGKKKELEKSNNRIRIFTIPPHSRSLWICNNQLKPDWQGWERFIAQGEKCSFIDKCLFCSQIGITEDSLPFLIERLERFNDQIEASEGIEFGNEIEDEISILESILNDWGDQEEIRKALRYCRQHGNLLPYDLRILSIIFEG